MSKRFLIVVNPASGNTNHENLVKEIRRFFDKRNIPFEIFRTQPAPFLGLENWNDMRSSFTDLLIVGGDGTLNGVVNAIINAPLPVGIIPAGTGNDFIKNLNLKDNLNDQLKNALEGKIHYVDVGRCNDRYFLNGVGIGFDGKVAERMVQYRKKRKGFKAYRTLVLQLLLIYKEKPMNYFIDNREFRENVFSLTIGNGTTFGGGFKVTPDARIDDGLLDVCLIGKINPVSRFLKLPLMKDGSHKNIRQTQFYKAKNVMIPTNDFLVAHIDGEFIGNPPFEISLAPVKIPVRANL